MRKFIYVIFILSFFLTSCSDNESSNLPLATESDIVGTWNLVDFYSKDGKFTMSTVSNGDISGSFEAKAKDFNNATTTFSQNPNESYDSGSFNMELQVKTAISSGTQTEIVTADPNIKTEWSLSDNTLFFNFENDFFTGQLSAQIIYFDENKLELKANFEENISTPEDVNLGVTNTKFKGTIYLTYTK